MSLHIRPQLSLTILLILFLVRLPVTGPAGLIPDATVVLAKVEVR